jgi:hypothetical protein
LKCEYPTLSRCRDDLTVPPVSSGSSPQPSTSIDVIRRTLVHREGLSTRRLPSRLTPLQTSLCADQPGPCDPLHLELMRNLFFRRHLRNIMTPAYQYCNAVFTANPLGHRRLSLNSRLYDPAHLGDLSRRLLITTRMPAPTAMNTTAFCVYTMQPRGRQNLYVTCESWRYMHLLKPESNTGMPVYNQEGLRQRPRLL